MEHWTEIRTAAEVARAGTISAAGEVLGLHRATVTRHIDALEKALGAKLFQRHKRGFTATELGLEMLRVADATADQFAELHRKAQGETDALSGDLIITSLDEMTLFLLPLILEFQHRYPEVTVRYISSEAPLKLEYGEAHLAFRLGKQPQEPDNIVRPFRKLRAALYASREYVAAHGAPLGPKDFAQHRFIGSDNPDTRAPFLRWLHEQVAPEAFVFRSNMVNAQSEAVLAGLGIGFLLEERARTDKNLVEVMAPREDWDVVAWTVTHVDLHRSAKVQAFLEVLKAG